LLLERRNPMNEKLVRDLIPEIIKNKGEHEEFREAEHSEKLNLLRDKLVEESLELQSASGRAAMLAELADVKESFDALCEYLHFCPQEIERIQRRKRTERGGFTKFFVLMPKQ
jgi:predicted house-cleaning noncanonical NTP pyrophosphatase (MazG superfamily)